MSKNQIITSYENDELSYEIIPYNKKEIKSAGYEKLPQETFERVSLALQSVPGQVAVKATEVAANKAAEGMAKNAYKLVLKDGLHLAKSKSLNGAYKGLAYLDSSNKLSTHADWIPVSLDGSFVTQAPQLALGVFNAMSIATGQYFLSQINGKLSSIEEGVSDIIGYLETEKRSEVIANDIAIMRIYSDLEYIMDNETARQSTSIELKTIKNKSLTNMLLFSSKVASTREKLKTVQKGKLTDLEDAERGLLKDIPQYWFAVRSYANASFLEAVVTEMDNPDYLDSLKEDIENKINQYIYDCDSSDRDIRTFIAKAHELNKNKKIPEFVDSIADLIPPWHPITAGIKIVGKVAVEVDSYAVEKSQIKKSIAEEIEKTFWTVCRNIEPLKEPIDLIDRYKKERNTPLEIVCTEDEAYVRHVDLAPINEKIQRMKQTEKVSVKSSSKKD